jgi:hypothetical protein
MPGKASFDYAVVRVVPRVEREEFLNVGIVLLSRERRFLGCRVSLDASRLRSLAPDIDLESIEAHLASFRAVCAGEALHAELPTEAERFHWLTAPKSTVVQTSPVHSGLTDDPGEELDHLVDTLVRFPASANSGPTGRTGQAER